MNATRDTSTGLNFEKKVILNKEGINLSKNNLYKFLKNKGIEWNKIISRKLLPDEAYYNEETKHFDIYEKKFQKTEGSADEKPQTCGFKICEFSKIGHAIGAENITYTYILSNWFKQEKYKDMLAYISSVEGCGYLFEDEIKQIDKS